MNLIKEKAREFIKNYLPNHELSIDILKCVLKRQGIVFMEYDFENNSDSTADLLKGLKMYDYAKEKSGFLYHYTYQNMYYIFLKANLDESTAIFTILHEEGHYMLKHLAVNGRFNATQEIAADTFARYILHYLRVKHIAHNIINHAKTVLILALSAALITVLCRKSEPSTVYISAPSPTGFVSPAPEQPTGIPYTFGDEYVVTTLNGTKIHNPDCTHIKSKPIIHIDRTEALNAGYTPCLDCNP